ncbi:MAG: ABC transporter permease [Planctomycetota bacterium]
MAILQDIKALYHYREVVVNLAGADLKLRYRRSMLGYAWSMLYPLLTLAIMAVVFTKVMALQDARGAGEARIGEMRNYVLYVFSGFLPWNFLVNGFWGAGASLVNHESILRKIYLPKLIFPVSVTLARFLDFLCNLIALFIIISFIAYRPSWALTMLPIAILILLIFTTGVTLALSAINVYIRDTSHLVTVLMQLGFYLTPIIYPISIVGAYQKYFLLNPFTHIIRLFQVIIWQGSFPTMNEWQIAVALACGALMIGYAIFARLERNLIFRL